jgi:hypothetical protein
MEKTNRKQQQQEIRTGKKFWHREAPNNSVKGLPIKRAAPKKPAGISARQWKKTYKAARRLAKAQAEEAQYATYSEVDNGG